MRTDAKISLAVVGVLILVVIAFSTVFSSKAKKQANKNTGVVTASKESEPAPVTPPPAEPPIAIGAPPSGGGTLPPPTGPLIGTAKPPIEPAMPRGGDTLIGGGNGFTPGTPDRAHDDKLGGTGVITDATPPAHVEPPAGRHAAADDHAVARAVAGHQYKIRANQTLSSIATEVYGNPKFWTVIAKANDGINPNRLKVGTVISVPDIDAVRSESNVRLAAVEETVAADSIASNRSYRVQGGDSLYRISKKLYGTSKRADEIYQLNCQLIGPDEARLKKGIVLQLPEPATAARLAAAAH